MRGSMKSLGLAPGTNAGEISWELDRGLQEAGTGAGQAVVTSIPFKKFPAKVGRDGHRP